jgi:ribosomal protein S18 acetylase RimI-like enzyme
MPAPFITRPFLPSDYDIVLKLWETTDGVEVAEGDSRLEIEAYLQRNPGLSRIAEIDGRLAGAVLCGHDGRRGLIYHLVVTSTARGRGMGRQLVRECMDGLKAAGMKRVLLLVGNENHPGRAFWIAQGFELIDEALALSREIP